MIQPLWSGAVKMLEVLGAATKTDSIEVLRKGETGLGVF